MVLFVRIGTYQWVTAIPNKNFSSPHPSPHRPKRGSPGAPSFSDWRNNVRRTSDFSQGARRKTFGVSHPPSSCGRRFGRAPFELPNSPSRNLDIRNKVPRAPTAARGSSLPPFALAVRGRKSTPRAWPYHAPIGRVVHDGRMIIWDSIFQKKMFAFIADAAGDCKTHSVIWVCSVSATSLAPSIATRVCQTWVRRPRCTSAQWPMRVAEAAAPPIVPRVAYSSQTFNAPPRISMPE